MKKLKNNEVEVSSTIINFREIESKIKTDKGLSDKEYVILRSILVTPTYSLNYWNENLNKWMSLNTKSKSTFSAKSDDWGWFSDSLGDMAVADAYGAGVGAVVGFVSSFWSGPGALVSTAAAAIGYGLNASGLTGVRAVLTKNF